VGGDVRAATYQVPAQQFESEIVIKKSRFIARVVPVTSREIALAAVQQARIDFPDARHHCWAYLLGRPGDASSAGMSDDGEPAGTAGKPILNVMHYSGIGDQVVIVIRYFGGIKLGAGGLVRAYGQATQQVLEQAPRRQLVCEVRAELLLDFSQEQALRHWLATHDGRIDEIGYDSGVRACVILPAALQEELADFARANSIQLQQGIDSKPR
jgi:uncharacterized YigZ family protein